ncbi:MAG: hypothetical protein A3J83_09140 [Elusimicrobia bacterium RIFOXYA2_FULL_40_6]|nr:MAG: hypothetical protein A3J83_09140 [Elusimicrobia bacterium RIFOXYA2_FULL_40_6]
MTFANVPNGSDMKIYSLSGKLVRSLSEADLGTGEIKWDGRNADGTYIAQGIYLYVLKTQGGQKKTGKIAVKR